MDKDSLNKVNRLEELAKLFADDKVSYGTYIAAANPAMILEMIAEMRKMWRQNNWDLAALQAYGALPEDIEVHIENESFAWHLNRIKTGLGKRLELAEKRLDDCLKEYEKLDMEADWLASMCSGLSSNAEGCEDCCLNGECSHNDIHTETMCTEPQDWREAARKAVSEANNE